VIPLFSIQISYGPPHKKFRLRAGLLPHIVCIRFSPNQSFQATIGTCLSLGSLQALSLRIMCASFFPLSLSEQEFFSGTSHCRNCFFYTETSAFAPVSDSVVLPQHNQSIEDLFGTFTVSFLSPLQQLFPLFLPRLQVFCKKLPHGPPCSLFSSL